MSHTVKNLITGEDVLVLSEEEWHERHARVVCECGSVHSINFRLPQPLNHFTSSGLADRGVALQTEGKRMTCVRCHLPVPPSHVATGAIACADKLQVDILGPLHFLCFNELCDELWKEHGQYKASFSEIEEMAK